MADGAPRPRVAAAAPADHRHRRNRHRLDEQRGRQHLPGRTAGASPWNERRQGGCRGGQRERQRDLQSAVPREIHQFLDTQREDGEGGDPEHDERRKPHHRHGDDDENGAAQDAGHFAPAAACDGLMPP